MFYTISVLRITPKSVTIGVNRKKDIYVAIKNIGSAPEKPTKPWRSSTFQCNWIKNYHSPWKRCLHYSKLWISIEWSHFLAINFNWNNLHLGLSHPVPSCPSEPISVVPLPFCTGFQLRSSSHEWIVPVKGTAQEPPSVATSLIPTCSPDFFSPIWCVLQPHWLIDWSIPLYTLIPSHHTCVCVFCTILSNGCNSM